MILLLKISFAQTSKHSWIVGGTALFSSKTSSTIVSDTGISALGLRNAQIKFSPDVGYFFSDRFVAGIKILYSINKLKVLNTSNNNLNKSIDYGVGPFMRYYFLPKTKKFNLFVDGSYQYGIEKRKEVIYVDGQPAFSKLIKYTGHSFSIAAGPVINFHSSIGFEILIGYTTSKYTSFIENNKTLLAGMGLQVYL